MHHAHFLEDLAAQADEMAALVRAEPTPLVGTLITAKIERMSRFEEQAIRLRAAAQFIRDLARPG